MNTADDVDGLKKKKVPWWLIPKGKRGRKKKKDKNLMEWLK
jgi:hypothetical protein